MSVTKAPANRVARRHSEEPIAYRPNAAAEALGVSRDVIFELIAKGELKSILVSKAIRLIPARCLHEYVEGKLAEAEAAG